MRKAELCLGTVQLGMSYGIETQSHAYPKIGEGVEILKTVYQAGVRYVDTAIAYGQAEDVIGTFHRQYPECSFQIISKLSPDFASDIVPPELGKVTNSLIHSIEASLARLETRILDGFLLHEAKDMYNDNIWGAMQEAKKAGLIKNIGVSIYLPEDALFAASLPRLDYIQIPYNILDQRLDKTEFFALAKANKKKVFARSPFLKGLLTRTPEQLPQGLSGAASYLQKMKVLCQRWGMTQSELALGFSAGHPGIDFVVVGVRNRVQLNDMLSLYEKVEAFTDEKREVAGRAFSQVPDEIIMPNLWA